MAENGTYKFYPAGSLMPVVCCYFYEETGKKNRDPIDKQCDISAVCVKLQSTAAVDSTANTGIHPGLCHGTLDYLVTKDLRK